MDWKDFDSVAKLWADYVSSKRALLKAGLIRSYKSTEADFSEWIISLVFDGEIPFSQSNPGYDVICKEKRIQVKSISKMVGNPHGYIVTNRDRKNNVQNGATHYAFVYFEGLIPEVIYIVPESFVREFKKKEIKRFDLENYCLIEKIDLSNFRNMVLDGN